MTTMGARQVLLMLAGLLLAPLLASAQTTLPSTRPATLPATAPAAIEAAGPAAIIVLDGDIDDVARRGLEKRIAEARTLGASTIILKLRTYGGLVTAGLDISRFIKQQSDLHIICYVHGRAISAGAMIAAACDQIVMEPNSQIGDSGVIAMMPGGGLAQVGATERAKMESPVIEDFRDSARQNGHPEPLLEAMVNVSRSVYWVENAQTGERRFVDEKGHAELTGGKVFGFGGGGSQWKAVEGVRSPIDGPESLLMLSTDLAVRVGFAREQVASVESFAASRGMRIVGTLEAGMSEQLVALLANDMVRAVLTTIFMLALYMAFHTPGSGAPEAVALIALSALLGVPALTGYAEWFEILAILLGIVLLAVELFILPGFGVSGITGIVLVLAGLTMTFVPPIIMPDVSSRDWSIDWVAIRNGFLYVIAAMTASLLLWVWLSRSLPKLPYARRLILSTVAGGPASMPGGVDAAESPEMPVVGEIGSALTDLRPGGMARFEGTSRVADVVSDSGFVRAGTRIIVREVAGSRVVVRPSDNGPAATA